MKTKKTLQPKVEDISNCRMVDPVNEKCKKILNSNLDDNLKVELIGLLQNPAPKIQGTLGPLVTYTTWEGYHPNNVEITCESR